MQQTGHASILVVDDNDANRLLMSAILETLGFGCMEAGNGRQAVELVEKNDFQFIFMDCHMPVMDGFEAAAAIRQIEKEGGRSGSRMVGVTADATALCRQRSISSGMDIVAVKPVTKSIISNLITNLENRQDPI